MSFDPLEVNRTPIATPWVSVGCHQHTGKYAQLKFSISASVARFLGVAVGDQISAYRGSGEHQGWVMLCKAKPGQEGFTLVQSSRNSDTGNVAFRVSSQFLYLHMGDHHATERMQDLVPETETNGSRVVYCQLPDWANKERPVDPWDPTPVPKPYRPANGTEGEFFMERFCYRCQHDAKYQRTNEPQDGCQILAATLAYNTDEAKYPKEWVYDKAGHGMCTAYKPTAATVAVKGESK
jgi:hypothetical protein